MHHNQFIRSIATNSSLKYALEPQFLPSREAVLTSGKRSVHIQDRIKELRCICVGPLSVGNDHVGEFEPGMRAWRVGGLSVTAARLWQGQVL